MGLGGLGGNMQQNMQQMLQNPQAMAEMMRNPAVQSMMQSFMSDPQRMEQMMQSNPMFAGNPEMVSTLDTPLPHLGTLVTHCNQDTS